MNRRQLFTAGAALGGAALITRSLVMADNAGTHPAKMTSEEASMKKVANHTTSGDFPAVKKTKAEWKQRLEFDRYRVLFEEDTERAGTSALNYEKRDGTFVCAACNLPLFKSGFKYESGTGWPSFFDKIDGSLGTKEDRKLWMTRTEYHCARCGGHQGHIFTDGPQPTGLRYCNNGLALNFVPVTEALPELVV